MHKIKKIGRFLYQHAETTSEKIAMTIMYLLMLLLVLALTYMFIEKCPPKGTEKVKTIKIYDVRIVNDSYSTSYFIDNRYIPRFKTTIYRANIKQPYMEIYNDYNIYPIYGKVYFNSTSNRKGARFKVYLPKEYRIN